MAFIIKKNYEFNIKNNMLSKKWLTFWIVEVPTRVFRRSIAENII